MSVTNAAYIWLLGKGKLFGCGEKDEVALGCSVHNWCKTSYTHRLNGLREEGDPGGTEATVVAISKSLFQD